MFDFSHDENTWRESEDSVAYFVSERTREQRDVAKRIDQITAGLLFPSMPALLDGMPPFRDDLRADIDVFVARSRSIACIPETLRDDLRDFGVWPAADGAIRVFDGASALPTDDDHSLAFVARRAEWYGALFVVPRLRDALYSAHRSVVHRHLCYRFGLEVGSHVLASAADWQPRYQEDISADGFLTLRRIASVVDMADWMRVNSDACDRFTSGKVQRSELFALANPIASSAERLAAVEKDIVAATTLINDATARQAAERSGEDAYGSVENDDQRLAAVLANLKDPKLRVIAKMPDVGSADQKTFARGFAPLADRATKLVVAQNVSDIASDLAREWPHAADVVHRILADVVDGDAIRMRPVHRLFLARSFRDLDDLNAQLRHWLDTVANPRTHTTTRRVVTEAFAEERMVLRPLPLAPFRSVLKLERRISREGMVSVGGNFHSVPDATRRRTVEVHTLADEVRIFEDGTLIAAHPVLEGRHGRRIESGHRTIHAGRRRHDGQSKLGTILLGAGDKVAQRPLAFYDAIGQALAQERRA